MTKIKPNRVLATIVSLAVLSISCLASAAEDTAEIVNVYSARKEALIKPLLDRFTRETGIKVNLITGKADALLKRLEVEGDATPADIFVTVDAGRLYRAKKAGILRVIDSPVLNQRIPSHLRDTEGYWYGMSLRARPIFYVKDKVDPKELSTYEDLSNPKWKGRICVRSSYSIYNQSLVASMVEADGTEKTQEWLNGLVANFARPPVGGDTEQLLAAAAGVCDIAISNTYYFGRLLNNKDIKKQQAAKKLQIFWPNQDERGAHVNVSGVGVIRYASHADNAIKLMEFMASDASQIWYAEINNEYPVVNNADISDTLKKFGSFKADEIELSKLGENNRIAVQLMDRAGWK